MMIWTNIMKKADEIAKEEMRLAYLTGVKIGLEQALEKCFEISEMLKICIKDVKNHEQKKL